MNRYSFCRDISGSESSQFLKHIWTDTNKNKTFWVIGIMAIQITLALKTFQTKMTQFFTNIHLIFLFPQYSSYLMHILGSDSCNTLKIKHWSKILLTSTFPLLQANFSPLKLAELEMYHGTSSNMQLESNFRVTN